MLQEKSSGLLQSASRIEQYLLARDRDIHSKVFVGFQVVQHHAGEMMHIDDYVHYSKAAQPGERDLKQGAASDFHQGLWTIVGKRAQARTETRSQSHRPHSLIFSSSRCRTITCTPFLSRKCFASC